MSTIESMNVRLVSVEKLGAGLTMEGKVQYELVDDANQRTASIEERLLSALEACTNRIDLLENKATIPMQHSPPAPLEGSLQANSKWRLRTSAGCIHRSPPSCSTQISSPKGSRVTSGNAARASRREMKSCSLGGPLLLPCALGP